MNLDHLLLLDDHITLLVLFTKDTVLPHIVSVIFIVVYVHL